MGCAHSDSLPVETVESTGAKTGPSKSVHRVPSRTSATQRRASRSFHRDYVLHQKLGKGAFAVVYLAHKAEAEPTSAEQVAVKISDLRPLMRRGVFDEENLEAEAKRAKATEKEIDMMRKVVGSTNVIRILDSYVEGGLSYVVLEKCDKTLLQVLERMVKLNEDTLKPMFKGMLAGLAHVHNQCVVHRDVKPDNFLCQGPNSTVKLCDFGLASKTASPDAADLAGVNGTPPYMAPEMLKNERYSSKVDTWSFGVIVYVLFFGRFPYKPVEQTGPAMKAAIASGTPAPTFRPSSTVSQKAFGQDGGFVSASGIAFVRALLNRELTARPTCQQALASDVFAEAGERSYSLRPILSAAKRCGAFDLPPSRGKAAPTVVDQRLQELQERQRRAASSATAGKVMSPMSEQSTEAAESSVNGSAASR